MLLPATAAAAAAAAAAVDQLFRQLYILAMHDQTELANLVATGRSDAWQGVGERRPSVVAASCLNTI